jgi:hypothetical protein
MFPVWYELGFYIPEDGILHSHRRENLKSYILPSTCFVVYSVAYNASSWKESLIQRLQLVSQSLTPYLPPVVSPVSHIPTKPTL